MDISPLAGKPAAKQMLVDLSRLEREYFECLPILMIPPSGSALARAGIAARPCGEESTGASFLRHDSRVWTTDKDGPIMNLLAAEITARTGKDPGEHYDALTAEFGTAYYARIDAPATPEQKAKLERLSPDAVETGSLAGEPIDAKLTRAPGNDAPIGGLKVVGRNGWFAARPVRDRSRLQDLRREPQGRAASASNPR